MTVETDAEPGAARPAGPRRRRLRTAVVIGTVGVLAGVGAAGVKAWWDDGTLAARIDPGCTAGTFEVSTDQAAVASDLVAVAVSRGLPARASTLLITAALQESKLRNVAAGAGDRDSVGVLQQRPSQGWGTAEQLADPTFAAGAFLDAVVRVDGWQTEPAADVIQAVQISIDGTLYAQHEDEAQQLADALDGTTPAGLTCRFAPPTEVAPPATVAAQVLEALPVSDPQVAGDTVTVPGAGWATAAWFVANADRLGVDRVAVADRTWTLADGWSAAGGQPVDDQQVEGVRATVATVG